MGEVPALQLLDLLLGLLDRHRLGVVDEQRDDLGLVDLRLPELLGELGVPAELLGVLPQAVDRSLRAQDGRNRLERVRRRTQREALRA